MQIPIIWICVFFCSEQLKNFQITKKIKDFVFVAGGSKNIPTTQNNIDSPSSTSLRLHDSPDHSKLLDKISMLQLTVDSLKKEKGNRDAEESSKSLDQTTVSVDIEDKVRVCLHRW